MFDRQKLMSKRLGMNALKRAEAEVTRLQNEATKIVENLQKKISELNQANQTKSDLDDNLRLKKSELEEANRQLTRDKGTADQEKSKENEMIKECNDQEAKYNEADTILIQQTDEESRAQREYEEALQRRELGEQKRVKERAEFKVTEQTGIRDRATNTYNDAQSRLNTAKNTQKTKEDHVRDAESKEKQAADSKLESVIEREREATRIFSDKENLHRTARNVLQESESKLKTKNSELLRKERAALESKNKLKAIENDLKMSEMNVTQLQQQMDQQEKLLKNENQKLESCAEKKRDTDAKLKGSVLKKQQLEDQQNRYENELNGKNQAMQEKKAEMMSIENQIKTKREAVETHTNSRQQTRNELEKVRENVTRNDQLLRENSNTIQTLTSTMETREATLRVNNITDLQIYFFNTNYHSPDLFTNSQPHQCRYGSNGHRETPAEVTLRMILQDPSFLGNVTAISDNIRDKSIVNFNWESISDYEYEEIYPGTDAPLKTFIDGHLETVLHTISTCQMGLCTDTRLRVLNINKVRVCDASAFGEQIDANPTATIFALAERLADIIREDYNELHKRPQSRSLTAQVASGPTISHTTAHTLKDYSEFFPHAA
ncbi:hypothetical protein I4U23_004427 [Adineta vaga]|nr:hypothetical protein I4U23_004427 [Adineta vaga]